MKTKVIKAKDIKHNWHLVDAKGKILGRLVTDIAIKLMGKHKPTFTPNLDNGDYVVVYNAGFVAVSGKKTTDKIYRHHTGFPGGFREVPFEKIMDKDPRVIITKAVSGMLPKNKLRADRLSRLKVFAGQKHPYAQQFKSTEK